MPINYLIGDATDPQGTGSKIIIHCCNDIGAWGAGFVKALSARWPEPEAEYQRLHQSQGGFKLGTVHFVEIKGVPGLCVANMIGQKGIKNRSGNDVPVRYPALYDCLEEVAKFASANAATVHAPRFGAGLAGGDWRIIECIVEKTLIQRGISVTVYDLAV